MTLQYNIWTEEQDLSRNLIQAGIYGFKVVNIIRKLTAKGNYEMLEVDLQLVDKSGLDKRLRDWIIIMDTMGWKLRHFAATCGLLEKYESGTLDSRDFMGKSGSVKVGVVDKKDEHKVPTGEKTNKVLDYLKVAACMQVCPTGASQDANVAHLAFNDPIPFGGVA